MPSVSLSCLQTKVDDGIIELSVYEPLRPALRANGVRLDNFLFTAPKSGAQLYCSLDRVPTYDIDGQPPVLEYIFQLRASAIRLPEVCSCLRNAALQSKHCHQVRGISGADVQPSI